MYFIVVSGLQVLPLSINGWMDLVYLPTCKISTQSLQGFLLPRVICAMLYTLNLSLLYYFFVFCPKYSPTAKMPAHISARIEHFAKSLKVIRNDTLEYSTCGVIVLLKCCLI